MAGLWIWAAAALAYAIFALWYGRGSRIAPDEVDGLVARAEAALPQATPTQLAALRRLLAADDGREFFMLNLVRLQPGAVAPPGGGPAQPAREVFEHYTRRYLPALLRRACHPALFGRAAGGYVEHLGVEPDPGWSFAGVVRYRSRRDLVTLITDPRFAPSHAYKLAAVSHTLAFPLAPGSVMLGPRVWMALVLALGAALVQLLARRAV